MLRPFSQLSWENPVLLKELRIGLRERRFFVTQLIFLVILLFVNISTVSMIVNENDVERLPEMGKTFFTVVFWVQAVLIGVITPGLTCGSLSGERERHSLDMVLSSRLSAIEIVAGKLGYAAFYVVLLLFSSLPIASVAFFLGGVSPGEAAQAYFELFVIGLLAAQVGLFFSARETRTNYATTQTYMVAFVAGVFCLPLYGVARTMDRSQLSPEWLLTPLQMIGVVALYAILFFFVKAAHRLKPRYAYIRILSLSFILFYLVFLGLALWAIHMAFVDGTLNDQIWGALLVPLALVHLGWGGMFCNDTDLPSSVERRAFAASPFSRSFFWLAFLALGVSAPVLFVRTLGVPSQDWVSLSAGCSLVALYILVFPLLARAVHRLGPGSNFAVVYFVLLALAFTLPLLGLLNGTPGIFSGVYLSPAMALSSLSNETGAYSIDFGGTTYSLAYCSALAYFALALLAVAVLAAKKRPPKT